MKKAHATKKQNDLSDNAGKNGLTSQPALVVQQFVDNRPETVAQRKLQEGADQSTQVGQLKVYQFGGKKAKEKRAAARVLEANNVEASAAFAGGDFKAAIANAKEGAAKPKPTTDAAGINSAAGGGAGNNQPVKPNPTIDAAGINSAAGGGAGNNQPVKPNPNVDAAEATATGTPVDSAAGGGADNKQPAKPGNVFDLKEMMANAKAKAAGGAGNKQPVKPNASTDAKAASAKAAALAAATEAAVELKLLLAKFKPIHTSLSFDTLERYEAAGFTIDCVEEYNEFKNEGGKKKHEIGILIRIHFGGKIMYTHFHVHEWNFPVTCGGHFKKARNAKEKNTLPIPKAQVQQVFDMVGYDPG